MKTIKFPNFEILRRRKEVKKEILSFSSKGATRAGDIFGKVLTANIKFYLKDLTNLTNHWLEKGVLTDKLKLDVVFLLCK